MARRRKDKGFVSLLVLGFISWIISLEEEFPIIETFLGLLVLGILIKIITAVSKNITKIIDDKKEKKHQQNMYNIEQERHQREIEKHNRLIQKHKPTLVQKYKQLTYTDDYGNFKKDGFLKELDYFIRNVLFDKQTPSDTDYEYEYNRLLLIIENAVEENPDIKVDNPYDFEKQCAEVLNKNGWQARATQKSSDKGIDVIATKDKITVALQCKLYSSPVGIKAVQEAFSGKEYYKANYAGVVTNNTFTIAARQLAKSCNIYLLSPENLNNLDEIISK